MSIELKVGDRIYYTGDMANRPGWFTVVALKADSYRHVELLEEGDDEPRHMFIPLSLFSAEYLGHCGTRFVTEAAYRRYYEERRANA